MQKSKPLDDAIETSFLSDINHLKKCFGDELIQKRNSMMEKNIRKIISSSEEDSGNDPELYTDANKAGKVPIVFVHNIKSGCIKSRRLKQRRLKIGTIVSFTSHSFPKSRNNGSKKNIKASSSIEKSRSIINEQYQKTNSTQSVYYNTLADPVKHNIHGKKKLYENDDDKHQDYSTDDTLASTREEHIYKIMQRKEKLNRLLQKLVEVRKKEKQEWNEFITQLKNKHGMKNNQTEPQVCFTETQTTCMNRTSWKPSENCKKIINDLYTASTPRSLNSLAQSSSQSNERCNKVGTHSYIFGNNLFCYPTASSGRLTILKRQKEAEIKRNNKKNLYKGMPIFPNIDDQKLESKYQSNYPNYLGQKSVVIKSNPVHEDLRNSPVSVDKAKYNTIDIENDRDNIKDSTMKSIYDSITSRVNKFKTKVDTNKKHAEAVSLTGIENKLEDLIVSINSLVVELQIKKSVHRIKNTKSVSIQKEDFEWRSNKKVNFNIEDELRLGKAEKYVCGMVLDSSASTLGAPEIENKLNRRECIRPAKAFSSNEIINRRDYKKTHDYLNDVPTKDIGTEVTKSLSKTKIEEVKAVRSLPRANLASNPQPLGILGLMKISADAVKGFLSYLPLVNGPEFSVQGMEMSRYVCNICGLAYDRASSLSEHIERRHCNGTARDCCVCRHLLDMERGPPRKFSCQFCGKRFTRAYCCELHQANCARALGLKNDVDSRLVFLR